MNKEVAILTARGAPLELSIIFPCYNEEENVDRVATAAVQFGRSFCSGFEVIIVNDGSRDRTREKAEALKERMVEVKTVHLSTNQGYGGAIGAGFRAAQLPWVFYTDGDGQFRFENIKDLTPLLDHADIISGYRIDRKDPWIRKFNGAAWSALVRYLFGLTLRDIDCAYKLFPLEALREIEMKSKGAFLVTEILARCSRLGYRTAEIGVPHYPREAGKQTGAKFSVILKAFRDLFLLYRELSRLPRRVSRLETKNRSSLAPHSRCGQKTSGGAAAGEPRMSQPRGGDPSLTLVKSLV